MLEESQFNPVFGAKQLHGQITEPFAWGDRLPKDAPGFFFHGYLMMGGADAQACDCLVVQFADAQIGHDRLHFMLARAGIVGACWRASNLSYEKAGFSVMPAQAGIQVVALSGFPPARE
jgi:hypothetical protein